MQNYGNWLDRLKAGRAVNTDNYAARMSVRPEEEDMTGSQQRKPTKRTGMDIMRVAAASGNQNASALGLMPAGFGRK